MIAENIYNKAKELRRDGFLLTEISKLLGIAKSTACEWCKDVDLSEEGKKRLVEIKHLNATKIKKSTGKRRTTYLQRRYAYYLEGYNSNISSLDGLGVGLYWGEGSKASRQFEFCNSDFDAVKCIIDWAINNGQQKYQFRARVQIHPEDSITEDDIKQYWSKCGIPFDRIKVYRIRSATSNGRTKNKTLHGTCSVSPIKNGVKLFEYLCGQRDKLIGREAKTVEA